LIGAGNAQFGIGTVVGILQSRELEGGAPLRLGVNLISRLSTTIIAFVAMVLTPLSFKYYALHGEEFHPVRKEREGA
jgi:hypothetical protein